MENLACIVFVFAVYCLWAIAAYQPKPAASPADYSDLKSDSQPATPKPTAAAKPIAKPVTVTQPLPAAAYVAPKPANTNGDRRLESMTIRQLYALASAKGIKRYKSMKKPELIASLG